MVVVRVLITMRPWRFSGHGNHGVPRRCLRDYVCHLARECRGIPKEKPENAAGERDIWTTLLTLLPQQASPR